MKAVALESERLFFEPLSLKHLSDAYVSWLNDKEVNAYLESRGGYDLDQLEKYLKERQDKEILFWAIFSKQTKKHIGNIKIDPITDKGSGEYGILMGDKNEWGKGYAKEASKTIISYCFQTLNLSEITLGVISKNERAVHLYKDLGFSVTSVTKDFGMYQNEMCDSIRMVKKNDR